MLNGFPAQLKVTLQMALVVQKVTPLNGCSNLFRPVSTKKYMYLLISRSRTIMVVGAIANFDSFVWIALGLFVLGLIGVMVYERSSSKAKRQQPQSQRQPSRPGTNTGIE